MLVKKMRGFSKGPTASNARKAAKQKNDLCDERQLQGLYLLPALCDNTQCLKDHLYMTLNQAILYEKFDKNLENVQKKCVTICNLIDKVEKLKSREILEFVEDGV